MKNCISVYLFFLVQVICDLILIGFPFVRAVGGGWLWDTDHTSYVNPPYPLGQLYYLKPAYFTTLQGVS